MSKYRVEYVTSRECDAVEGAGAWCVIERKRTHDEVINQFEHEENARIHCWGLSYTTGAATPRN